MAAPAHFTKQTFAFLRELKANNDREWFTANKARYEEHIKDASLRFIADFAPRLMKLSPHFVAGPRSLFRIYRDTRFSKDKTPYKTHLGIHFRHDLAKSAHAPGFYLHLEPGSVFAALGIWHPESAALRAIRDAIVEKPSAWKKASSSKTFAGTFALEGDRLSRAPKDYDPDHPHIEDLKRKDFIAVRELPESFALQANLPAELSKIWKAGTPLVDFLCGALGVPF